MLHEAGGGGTGLPWSALIPPTHRVDNRSRRHKARCKVSSKCNPLRQIAPPEKIFVGGLRRGNMGGTEGLCVSLYQKRQVLREQLFKAPVGLSSRGADDTALLSMGPQMSVFRRNFLFSLLVCYRTSCTGLT